MDLRIIAKLSAMKNITRRKFAHGFFTALIKSDLLRPHRERPMPSMPFSDCSTLHAGAM